MRIAFGPVLGKGDMEGMKDAWGNRSRLADMYIASPAPIWRRLLAQAVRLADARALLNAGTRMPTKRPITEIVTSSSMRVNARRMVDFIPPGIALPDRTEFYQA